MSGTSGEVGYKQYIEDFHSQVLTGTDFDTLTNPDFSTTNIESIIKAQQASGNPFTKSLFHRGTPPGASNGVYDISTNLANRITPIFPILL